MSPQARLRFDSRESERRKEEGMSQAVKARGTLLEYARSVALTLGDRVSADDVAKAMAARGIDMSLLGNAAGSLFRDGNWEWRGEWTKATRVASHQNDLRVWRRK